VKYEKRRTKNFLRAALFWDVGPLGSVEEQKLAAHFGGGRNIETDFSFLIRVSKPIVTHLTVYRAYTIEWCRFKS
jgi:hypothetical protein